MTQRGASARFHAVAAETFVTIHDPVEARLRSSGPAGRTANPRRAALAGEPVAARAGVAAIEMIENENLLESARRLSDLFRDQLEGVRQRHGAIRELRVLGLMIGVELSMPGAPVVESCLKRRLLVNCTQGNVIRLLPAMNLTAEQVEEGCDLLAQALEEAT